MPRPVSLLLVLFLFSLFSPPEAVAEGEETPFQRLAEAAGVGTDDDFRALLKKEKQRTDFAAPSAFRKLFQGLDIHRVELSRGVGHDGERAELVWWCGEVAIKEPDTDVVQKTISGVLTGEGFERVKGEELQTWRRTHPGDVVEEVAFEGPIDYTGGPSCGIAGLRWTVRDGASSSRPTLGEVVRAIPYLRDDRIDPVIYELLGDIPVKDVMLGGTWTKYYSLGFGLVAKPPTTGGAGKLRKRILKVFETAGFKPDEGDRLKRAGKTTDAYATIRPPSAGWVRVFIQPES